MKIRIPEAAAEYSRNHFTELARSITVLAARIPEPQNLDNYSTTNVTTSRTFDADTVTLTELADIVGTLIEDLKSAGY
jgi:hypothetical protein